MSEPTLSELRALAAVAARRNFRAAAAEVSTSPSALSHAVAGLERRLGIRLFNRTTRSVSLTDAGRDFLARVAPALAEIEAAVETVNRFRATPTGCLRLNGSEGGFERLMPTIVSFTEAYPDMRVEAVVEGRIVDIVAEGFDAGVRLAECVPQDMVAVSLGQDEAMIVVASPCYIQKRGAPETPADLHAHDCIRARFPSGLPMRWEFERHGKVQRIEPQGRLTLGGDQLTLQAALAGAGLAWVTAWSAASHLADGRLTQVLADWTPPFEGLCLYYPKQRAPSTGLKAFVDHLNAAKKRESVDNPNR
ncbi:LysR family transcriptional regulator [Brevundimonas sp. NIBR11]|uniref:LysR family transcriptional regulator n=1 Tax=Brevundimonas sp. NIBR11 TaxID=3015999 RepID=UPI0022F1021F|nr:LysR family transcriptional regulator [Brevundimonas sp. NIBR11]WGM30247.1 HTH-type transcriptional regulator PgrR [Brevundimonas sp. NIBR11]